MLILQFEHSTLASSWVVGSGLYQYLPVSIGVDLAELLGEAWRAPKVGPCRVGWHMGIWGGVSPLQPTKGSGGASWAPPAGSGAENGFWRILKATERSFLYLYDKIWGTICVSVPRSKFWGGTCPPVSTWSTPMPVSGGSDRVGPDRVTENGRVDISGLK